MAPRQNTTTDEPETLNSVELTDLNAAKKALSYLREDYNGGDVYEAEGGRCLVVISRSRNFQHFSLFQRCANVDITNCTAVNMDGSERLKVEIREADR